LNARSRIQLSGHEHDQRVVAGRDWVKLYAGSVNPHRAEPNWKPGYNIVEVHVVDGDPRRMVVDVHAREWQGEPPQFRAYEDVNNKAVHRVTIDLPPLQRIRRAKNSAAAGDMNSAASGDAAASAPAPDAATRLSLRSVANRFFRLSQSQKNEIVGSLDLALDDDNRLPDFERFKRALQRAKQSSKLGEVEVMIAARENGA